MGRTRSRWTLSGLFANYVVVDALRAPPRADEPRPPLLAITSMIDTWLASPFDAATVYEIAEALGAFTSRGLGAGARAREHEHIKRRLTEALERGRLVALEVGRVHPAFLAADMADPVSAGPASPEEAPEPTFIALEMVDEDGEPVPNLKYRITFPDGYKREGTLNENGHARIEGVTPGTCQISFSGLDGRAWEAA